MLFHWVNRRSQKRSYTWAPFQRRIRFHPLQRPPGGVDLLSLFLRAWCCEETQNEEPYAYGHVRFCGKRRAKSGVCSMVSPPSAVATAGLARTPAFWVGAALAFLLACGGGGSSVEGGAADMACDADSSCGTAGGRMGQAGAAGGSAGSGMDQAGAAGGNAGSGMGQAGAAGGNAGSGMGQAGAAGGNAGSGPPVDPPSGCGASDVASGNLAVCSATWLGGTTTSFLDSPRAAVEIAADGSVLVGIATDDNFGAPVVTLADGGAGAIFRFSPDGRRLLSATRVASTIHDIKLQPGTGRIGVVGQNRVALLSPTADKLEWSAAISAMAPRLSLGSDGTIAVQGDRGGEILIFNGSEATPQHTLSVGGADFAIDGASKTVVVGGSFQDNGGGCSELRVPTLRGFSYTGQMRWSGYGWGDVKQSPLSLCADGAVSRVRMGRDGKVVFAAYSEGGNSPFARDPLDITKTISAANPAPAGEPSRLSHHIPTRTSANPILFVGRIEAATGALIKAAWTLVRRPTEGGGIPRGGATLIGQTRLSFDDGVGAVAVDEQGHVLVGGAQGCCIPGRGATAADTKLQVAGQKVGRYPGDVQEQDGAYEGFVLSFAPGFARRTLWHTFSTDAGVASRTRAVAIGGGTAAAVLTSGRRTPSSSAGLITFQPAISAGPVGDLAFYLVVWRTGGL
jgi:hypothetical protein